MANEPTPRTDRPRAPLPDGELGGEAPCYAHLFGDDVFGGDVFGEHRADVSATDDDVSAPGERAPDESSANEPLT